MRAGLAWRRLRVSRPGLRSECDGLCRSTRGRAVVGDAFMSDPLAAPSGVRRPRRGGSRSTNGDCPKRRTRGVLDLVLALRTERALPGRRLTAGKVLLGRGVGGGLEPPRPIRALGPQPPKGRSFRLLRFYCCCSGRYGRHRWQLLETESKSVEMRFGSGIGSVSSNCTLGIASAARNFSATQQVTIQVPVARGRVVGSAARRW
jgi:hypothetical protein